jgi:hypothetical protein
VIVNSDKLLISLYPYPFISKRKGGRLLRKDTYSRFSAPAVDSFASLLGSYGTEPWLRSRGDGNHC